MSARGNAAPLSRRELLVATAACAAAGAPLALATTNAPAAAAAGAAPRARRALRKAIGLGMIGEGASVLDKLTLARDVGFEGVEVDRPSELALDELLAASQKSGVRIHGVVDSRHWSDTLGDPSAEVRAKGAAALESALRDGKRLGATSVLLVPAVVSERVSYADAYARSQAEIARLLPLAAELGVAIAIENVWNQFLLSPLEAARYVDELAAASPAAAAAIGWHLDLGNVINYGWPEQWVRALGARIRKLHVKDFSRKKRDEQGLWKGFDVELGEGDCDWRAVMAALDEIGYSTAPAGNWATAEVRGGDRERLKAIAERMDRLFAA